MTPARHGAFPQISLPSMPTPKGHPSSGAEPGWPPAPATLPGWLPPMGTTPWRAVGTWGQAGLTPCPHTGRVPALPTLRDPQGPAWGLAVPGQRQRHPGVQLQLPQQPGDPAGLQLRCPPGAVTRAPLGAELGSGSSPAPAWPRRDRRSSASGGWRARAVPPAPPFPQLAPPPARPAATWVAVSPPTCSRPSCHPPCPARTPSPCRAVPRVLGWCTGPQPRALSAPNQATPRARAEPGSKGCAGQRAPSHGATGAGSDPRPAVPGQQALRDGSGERNRHGQGATGSPGRGGRRAPAPQTPPPGSSQEQMWERDGGEAGQAQATYPSSPQSIKASQATQA